MEAGTFVVEKRSISRLPPSELKAHTESLIDVPEKIGEVDPFGCPNC